MAIQVDINQAPEKKVGEATPKTENEKLIDTILKMQAEGKASRARWDSDWSTYWEYYKDKQWNDQSRAPYRAKPVINIIRHTIQAQLPLITDNRPGFDLIPQEPSDYEFADMMSKATQYWWDKYQNDAVVIDGELDAMVADVGIFKTTWDQELNNGAGDIRMIAVDPVDVWVNRDATDFRREDSCQWVIHRMYKPIGWAKMQWPDKADQITPDTVTGTVSTEDKSVNNVTLISPTDQRDDRGQKPQSGSTDTRSLVELWEVWMDDDTIEEYELAETDAGGKPKKGYKKKYPKGRLITIQPNKKLVLQDVENPNKDTCALNNPFAKVVDNNLPRSFPGEGEAKILMEVQRLLNKNAANIVDYMTLMSNPIWKVKVGATDNPEMLTNRAGLVVLINDGYTMDDIRRDIPPALPANATEFYDLCWDTANKLTGMSELSQGRRSQGDPTAGYAIVSMQEATQTRIRLKERNLQRALSQVGKQWVGLALQYYRKPRIAKITGKDEWPEYFEFFIEETPDGKYKMNKRAYDRKETPDGQQKYVPANAYSSTVPTKGVFDVQVLSGSSMPFAKSQRNNMAFKLYEGQIIDDEEVLKTLEWPNKEDVLNRKREKEQAIAQQQAMEGKNAV